MRAAHSIGVLGFGAVSMACLVVGALCLRSWRQSGDRLFLFFAIGFWVAGLSWTALTIAIGFDRMGR
jgi:hypothetical protein